MIELGFFSFISTLIFCFLGSIHAFWQNGKDLNYNWLIAGQFSFSSLAFICLVWAHVTSDFSVRVVANHNHSLMSFFYKLTSVWGQHEGSELFNFFMISMVSWIFLIVERKIPVGQMKKIQSIQCLILFLMGSYILFTANPFERLLPFPREGAGLNPLLHDVGLAYHPPILFSGSCLLSLVYSIAVAKCFDKNLSLSILRKWSLLAFGFLTLGISLGSFWAYYVLGWGGWWFWDPVEALSLLPWLVLLISIHSMGLKENHRFVVFFNMMAFIGFLLSTLVIRSGVLTSVHNFAVDDIGSYCLLFIVFILLLFGINKILPYQKNRWSQFVSKKDKILILHMIFVSYALFIVLLGVFGPIVYKFIWNESLSLGPRYFSTLLLPAFYVWILLLLYFYITFSDRGALKTIVTLFFLSLMSGLCVYLTYAQSENSVSNVIFGSLMIGLGIAGCLASVLSTFIRLRKKMTIQVAQCFSHFGLGIFIIGLAFGYYIETESFKNISEGQVVSILGDNYHLKSIYKLPKLNSLSTVADIFIIDKNRMVQKKSQPERRYFYYSDSFYPISDMIFKGLEVYQVTLGEPNIDGTWQIRIKKSPLLLLVWLGGIFIFAGCLVDFFRRGDLGK